MENKLVVAVIDSGMDTLDPSFQDLEYEDYYYEDGIFQKSYAGSLNLHGTDVIKVILKEMPQVKIISIRVLRENNKCALGDIIAAINFSIQLNVDVINLSLGSCSAKSARISQLKEACELAAEKGIALFAAEHNGMEENAFPANFDCVVGVMSTGVSKPYCTIQYGKCMIQFSESYVFVPDYGRTTVRQGNSFLCPLIAGMYCRFIEQKERKRLYVLEFLDFFQQLLINKNMEHIFFNRYDEAERNSFQNKKVLFFSDDDLDLNNIKLFEMYREVCRIERCFSDIYLKTDQEITERIKDIDIFLIGALSNGYMNENKEFMLHLTELLLKAGVRTVTVYPYINTFERIELTDSGQGEIKSIYK